MVTYIIQQGDTLYKIANQYGVSVQDVITANPGVNPFNLHAEAGGRENSFFKLPRRNDRP